MLLTSIKGINIIIVIIVLFDGPSAVLPLLWDSSRAVQTGACHCSDVFPCVLAQHAPDTAAQQLVTAVTQHVPGSTDRKQAAISHTPVKARLLCHMTAAAAAVILSLAFGK